MLSMDSQTLEEIKKNLLEQKESILANLDEKESLGIVQEEMADSVDRSTAETDRNFSLKIKDRERKLIRKIDEALERIEKNEYGNCSECGSKISIGRLKARPMAELCIDCKEEKEKVERLEVD